MTAASFTAISKRVRLDSNNNRERQCIGPKKFQRSISRGLCFGPGAETKGWLPETTAFFAPKPKYKDGKKLEELTFQARCLFCDRIRLSDRDSADQFRKLSTADLSSLSDEKVALAAQMVPSHRQEAFAILIKRTESMRIKATKTCAYSAGYSEEDTLVNTMEGVFWAVWSFNPKKNTKFRTHAYNWIRKHGSNRSLNNQPLSDQIGRNQRNGKDEREKKINIAVVSPQGDPKAPTHFGGSESTQSPFDRISKGKCDVDQGIIMDLQDKLDILEDEVRSMIERKFFNNETETDISKATGLSRGVVANKIANGLALLNHALRGYKED